MSTTGKRLLKFFDSAAFITTVIAGGAAAIAGGYGWTRTAVAAGCIAGIAPIVNRIVGNHEQKALLKQLGPRTLSAKQQQQLIESLRAGPSFELWVAHNRHEAEPAALHKQIFEALSAAGLKPQWFGGMTNSTIGVEISGDPSANKTRLMDAFALAKIPYLNIDFTDKDTNPMAAGIGVWIGLKPDPSQH